MQAFFLNVALSAVADRTPWQWIVIILQRNWSQFLTGAAVTLLIAITGTVVGFAIGLVIGVIRTVPRLPEMRWPKRLLHRIVDILLSIYIEVFRGTPMIVQAMVIFYGSALMFGIYMSPIGAGLFIVSINTGAYLAEIVRGGILSIDPGQAEAASALGMTHGQTMTSVVLPQAVRNILPALGNEFVINIKDTSVLNIIAVSELFFSAKSVAGSNLKYFEVFLVASVIYLFMTFTVTRILRLAERKLAGADHFTIHGSQSVPEAQLIVRGRGRMK